MDYVPLSAASALAVKFGFELADVPFREQDPPWRRVIVFYRSTSTTPQLSVMSFPVEDGELVSSILYEWYSRRLANEAGA